MPLRSPDVHSASTVLTPVAPVAPTAAPWARWDWRVLGVTAVVSLAAAVAVTVALRLEPLYVVAVRDPLAVAQSGDPLPYFTGWLTYAGATLWFASAALALLAGRASLGRGQRRAGLLLLGFSFVSAVLATDDLFMLHDGVLARFASEEAVMGTWAVLALAWGLVFRRDLLADVDLPVLALSAALFAHSLVADVAGDLFLHEESTKFAATLCWAVWAWRRSARAVAPVAMR